LKIAKGWGLSISEWDNLLDIQKAEYRKFARAENRKEMFDVAWEYKKKQANAKPKTRKR
jgi:hypothetical protein